MSRYVAVLILLTVFYQCDGHVGRLADAILGAHKHVHDTVHNIASSVVGGFTGGFNFNFGGHGGLQRPPYDHPQYQNPPENRPIQGNDYNEQQGHQNGHGTQQGQYGNNQVTSTPPNQYNDQPSSENKPVHQNDANGPLHRPEQQNNPNQEQDRDVKKPTEIPNDQTKTTLGTTTYTNEPVSTDKPHTTKSDDDTPPLFVPLSPDQYKYDGDKIEVNAPKRDTDKTQEYDIDIRFRDE